jgi:hypothetical protein
MGKARRGELTTVNSERKVCVYNCSSQLSSEM